MSRRLDAGLRGVAPAVRRVGVPGTDARQPDRGLLKTPVRVALLVSCLLALLLLLSLDPFLGIGLVVLAFLLVVVLELIVLVTHTGRASRAVFGKQDGDARL